MKVIGNLQILGQKSIIKMDPYLTSGNVYSGWITEGQAETALTEGQVLYCVSLKHTWAPAQANDINTMPARGIALENIAAGATGKILRFGTFATPSAKLSDPNYNFNTPFIYVSTTVAGEVTKNRPATANSIIQKVGTPLNNNVGWYDFNTSLTQIDSSLNEIPLSYS